MAVAHVFTVALQGIEPREVGVQVHNGEGGNGLITMVGLADKAVAESRERCSFGASPSIWRRPICPREVRVTLHAGVTGVAGVLPAALAASEQRRGLIFPAANALEAAFAGGIEILARPP